MSFRDYDDNSYADDDNDYVSPVEDEFFDYIYNTDMSPQDKYLYELAQSLYAKCASLYNKNYTFQDNYIDLPWDEFPYAEISARFPHTYNQIVVHMAEACDECRDRQSPNNTIYGNGYTTFIMSNPNNTNITTPFMVSVVERLARHVNVKIRSNTEIYGLVHLLFVYAIQFGSIPLFELLDKTSSAFKNCNQYMFYYMAQSQYTYIQAGFDYTAIQQARIHMAKSLDIFHMPMIGFSVANHFITAIRNQLYLVAEYMLYECKHKQNVNIFSGDTRWIPYIEKEFVNACTLGNMEAVNMFCKFDPYKYCVHQNLTNTSDLSDTCIPISESYYGMMYSPKNQQWRRRRLVLQALHFNKSHSSLPIDVVRMISAY